MKMDVQRTTKVSKKKEFAFNISTSTKMRESKKSCGKSAALSKKLTATAVTSVRSFECLRENNIDCAKRSHDRTGDVVEKGINKPSFRTMMQRKSVIGKLKMDLADLEDVTVIDNFINVLKCGYCTKQFSDDDALISHLLTHDSMANRPLRLIKNKNKNGQLKVGNTSQNKNVPDITGTEGEQVLKKCNVFIPSKRQNKINLKLSSKTGLTSTKSTKPKRKACNKQVIRTEMLDSTNAITKRQENIDGRGFIVRTLHPRLTRKNNQSVNEGAEIPRLAMASVGKRNARKRHNDDFIRYDLNTKKTRHNIQGANGTKILSEVIDKQKVIKDSCAPKKSAMNSRNICRLKYKDSEATIKLEDFPLRNEEKKGTHNTPASVRVVQEQIEAASLKDNFLNVCKSYGHSSNFSGSINAIEKETAKNKNIGVQPGCSGRPLSRQVKISKWKSGTFLRCVTCGLCFLWNKPFLDHLKVHQNEFPFECIQCGKRFVSFFSYMTHMRNFHSLGKKAHCCRKCGKGYGSWYLLKLHCIRHKKFSPCSKFVCIMCDKSFPYKYALSRHLASDHNGTTEEALVPLSCKPCEKSFKDRRNLWIHQKRHPNVVKPYKCHLCHRNFAVHKWLIDHVQRHFLERNYSCSLCSKCYFTKTDAAMHERRHTKEATFLCSECDKRFIYRSELNAHTKRHQGFRLPKNIACDICSKAFSTRRDLERHLTVHTGEKPYKCSVCSKCFSQEVNMQVHVKIHSGDRPYQCDLCDKKFLAKSKLSRHRRCHATSKGMLPRPFKCVLCPKKYTAENSLVRHLRTHRDSVEIVTNIKSALKKASQESSTVQPSACAGAVLACMIDQAILDARRMAHSRKIQGTTGDLSLAEIIDQAIHDSKTTSSTQTPIVTENCDGTQISSQLHLSDSSKNTEFARATAKDGKISESATDFSRQSCSDLIKLISDVLSKHTGTNHKVQTKKSTIYPSFSIEDPVTQTVVDKPKSTGFKSDQLVWISKDGSHNLQLTTDQEMITSGPQRSLPKPIVATNDMMNSNPTMKISLGSSDSRLIFADNLNLTTDVHSFQNKVLVMPISDLGTAEPEQQVIFLDTLNEQSSLLHSSPLGSYNPCQQQNILSMNGKITLIVLPASPGKDMRSLHSSVNHLQQLVLPKEATNLTKKDQFVLVPTGTNTKSQSLSLKSTSPRKMEHSIGNNSGKHLLMISSLDETSCLPIMITNSVDIDETSGCYTE